MVPVFLVGNRTPSQVARNSLMCVYIRGSPMGLMKDMIRTSLGFMMSCKCLVGITIIYEAVSRLWER
ncbi:putative lipoate-protein ligase A [Fusarium oxysporum f. sp. albedinis]|nr:putative lipoate-protein ligase A [Fusarium oxysporum f. sp. albedinis]